jgi:hypothetical protein
MALNPFARTAPTSALLLLPILASCHTGDSRRPTGAHAAPASPARVASAVARGAQTQAGQAQPIPVTIQKKGDGFQLLRGGQPYFIKGAGGDGSKPDLLAAGANSFRTWGADGSQARLDEAHKLGLTMTLGLWLGHKAHGFDYSNTAQVAAQYADATRNIDKFKNHPALLMWGIGNEMEMGQEDNVEMWKAIEAIAAYAKKVDPNHPTMTVVAEIGGDKVAMINKHCPSIDVIGLNSYGGGPSLAQRYKAAGGVKPYVITEFGPPGTWEVGKNSWNASPELSSTDKAEAYRQTYIKAVANQPMSLGSYAFTWGNKQEATATWFGLLLPDGSRLGAVDALSELWTGKPPQNRAPLIKSLKLDGAGAKDRVAPGSTVRVALAAEDVEKDPLKVSWVLQHDPVSNNTGGATEATPPTYPEAIVKSDARSAELKMPAYGGGYRVFAFVHDGKGGAAVANVPLFVEGGAEAPAGATRQARLPLVVFEEAGEGAYIPSGYMGNATAIKMDPNWETNPRSGKTCLKVDYTVGDNWGGVVWQSPANDWGDQPGGWNLSGAKKLSFWARGEKGGEVVSFSLGLIGKDKKFHDTASNQLEKVRLTDEWSQYTMYLKGQDLSTIKTGFAWVVAGQKQPITFYLDDIKYE